MFFIRYEIIRNEGNLYNCTVNNYANDDILMYIFNFHKNVCLLYNTTTSFGSNASSPTLEHFQARKNICTFIFL